MPPGRITNNRTGRTVHHCPKDGQNCDYDKKLKYCKKHQYTYRGCGWNVMIGAECKSCAMKNAVSFKKVAQLTLDLLTSLFSCPQLVKRRWRRRVERKVRHQNSTNSWPGARGRLVMPSAPALELTDTFMRCWLHLQ